jgi:serine/threonine protein kinase
MSEHLLAGRYRLKSLLGSGGMGRVWRAHDEFLGRTVAVKEVLLPTETVAADEHAQLCERTIREARAAAALTHPSIITVHDVLNEGNRPWIVMDLIHGRSLEEIRTSDGPMPPQRVAQIGLQLLDALAVAHCHGILHRDVKPHNVLLGNDARAVLTDFGIATRTGDHRLTSADGMLGSPGYMAPERLQEDDAGPSSDLWSLAATLYTAVEGEPPFHGNDVLALLGNVLTQPPVPPRRAGPLGEVLLATLEKHPAARPHPSDLHRVFHAVATGSVPPPKVWTGPAMAAPALTARPRYEAFHTGGSVPPRPAPNSTGRRLAGTLP